MKLETKFDIGQEVYRISDYLDDIISFEIKQIRISNIRIPEYYVNRDSKWGYYESELFATKEEAEAKLKEIMK